MVKDNVMYHLIVMQALAGVRKQEAALKAERESLAERLRAVEADSTARVRQAVEVVEDLKVQAICILHAGSSVSCLDHAQQRCLNDTTLSNKSSVQLQLHVASQLYFSCTAGWRRGRIVHD